MVTTACRWLLGYRLNHLLFVAQGCTLKVFPQGGSCRKYMDAHLLLSTDWIMKTVASLKTVHVMM